MKKVIFAVLVAAFATAAYAACTEQVFVLPNGKIVRCMVCCAGNTSACTTNCY